MYIEVKETLNNINLSHGCGEKFIRKNRKAKTLNVKFRRYMIHLLNYKEQINLNSFGRTSLNAT